MRAVAQLGRIMLDNGRLDEAAQFMEEALGRAGEGADGTEAADVLANLSRAYMRLDRNQHAIDIADRALKIAEVRNLERIVTEAFINKASSLNRLGRIRESLALHEMSVTMADRYGFFDLQLRGRNNLSVAQIENDPERALLTVFEAIEIARRVGQRGMFNWLAGTAAMFSVQMGHDWQRGLALVEETLASSAPDYDRARATMIRGLVLAVRGKELERIVAAAEEARGDLTDGQILGGIEYLRATVAFVQGKWAEALAAARRAVESWPDSRPFVLQVGIEAAAQMGSATEAHDLRRSLDDFLGGSATVLAARGLATAVDDALAGRSADALSGFRTTIDAMRAIGLEFDAARAIIDALAVLPGEADVRGWAPIAREIFERLDAEPYLALLDDAIAKAGPESPAARSHAEATARLPAG